MKLPKLVYLLVVIILFPCRLFAWGHAGHQMVAELAMSMLSDATRVKVERVLNGMSPAKAGSWMDEVRSNSKYKYTGPWHYVNIEPGGSYKPAPGGDIITALNKAYTELQHPEKLTPEQVKFDVLVLFHLCGDLLQPLHVGYGSDKGGNTYQVNYNGKGTNLHSVWDSRIIERQNITLTLLKGDKQRSDASVQKLRIQSVNFMESLNQSRRLLPQVYDVKGHKLDDSYLLTNRAVVISQLYRGGTLLAACLEKLFSKASYIPVAAGSPAITGSQKPAVAGKALVPAGTTRNHKRSRGWW